MASASTAVIPEAGWINRIRDPQSPRRPAAPLIGVLPGEGIGAEVVEAALDTLRIMEGATARPVKVEVGGPIGTVAERDAGTVLPPEVVGFCEDVFRRGGAILSGPGGGRYVYDLRRKLRLFMKVSPIGARLGFAQASPLRPEQVDSVDFLIVRENLGGVYQGRSEETSPRDGESVVEHRFSYAEADVHRFLESAARLASSRRGELTVVVKQAGLPELTNLWRDVAGAVCGVEGIACSFVDVDLMAYQMIERPQVLDTVAAPNLFGDILGDLAAVLIGSRAISFGASYDSDGAGVYQTTHGSAYDIAGTGRANPVGQILSLAAMLRESLDREREAWALEEGVRRTWADGGTTADLGGELGTEEMAHRVGGAAAEILAATSE